MLCEQKYLLDISRRPLVDGSSTRGLPSHSPDPSVGGAERGPSFDTLLSTQTIIEGRLKPGTPLLYTTIRDLLFLLNRIETGYRSIYMIGGKHLVSDDDLSDAHL